MDSVPVDSVPVIPWPFRNPPEFRGMEITILAGSTAKIPFRGIPGITRIPADSGRNTWGTVKHSDWWTCECWPCSNRSGLSDEDTDSEILYRFDQSFTSRITRPHELNQFGFCHASQGPVNILKIRIAGIKKI